MCSSESPRSRRMGLGNSRPERGRRRGQRRADGHRRAIEMRRSRWGRRLRFSTNHRPGCVDGMVGRLLLVDLAPRTRVTRPRRATSAARTRPSRSPPPASIPLAAASGSRLHCKRPGAFRSACWRGRGGAGRPRVSADRATQCVQAADCGPNSIFQRSGVSSSTRLAGCVATRTRTSRR